MQGKVVAPGPHRTSRLLLAYVVGALIAWSYIELGWWWWRAKWRLRAVFPWDLRRWL